MASAELQSKLLVSLVAVATVDCVYIVGVNLADSVPALRTVDCLAFDGNGVTARAVADGTVSLAVRK